MRNKGKVGTSGREITRTLWGPDGRPETEEYREECAKRGLPSGLVPAPRLEKRPLSPRTITDINGSTR